ncbi:colipase-like protein 2 [Herpailurus yagouaroundi]|uniref:Colipase-like protein 2 n=1 Tax=Puma concolor TaxID=9696 RepID=A0A6P6I1B5_PUMCO|nr:colipase-like protein 2 [Puma concolor]XP_040329245.1 colipase-like protein 2 [Puma yagouaroundi]
MLRPMATAFLLLMGVLLPYQGKFWPFHKKKFMKMNGAECSHHSECVSDCCLMDLNNRGALCAPKARVARLCLPQTKGSINIICPCQWGLKCISKDPTCSRRCHLI